MTNTKLAAAGATNVAAMIRTRSLFDKLTVEQRNTLRTTAYGSDAGKYYWNAKCYNGFFSLELEAAHVF